MREVRGSAGSKVVRLEVSGAVGVPRLAGATSSTGTAYPLVSEAGAATAYKYVSAVINGLQLSKYEGIPTPGVA